MQNNLQNRGNITNISFMVCAMTGFAIEDAIIKQLAIKLPISQVLVSVGLTGSIIFYCLSILQKDSVLQRRFIDLRFFLRMLCELISSVLFVITMVYVSLTVSSALLQLTPILMTLGSFLLFKERILPKQCVLVLVGLFGALLVIQPGMEIFNPVSLFAVVGAFFLASRDLLTRSMANDFPPLAIAFWGFISLALGGIFAIPFFGPFNTFSSVDFLLIGASSFFGPMAYLALVFATRGGDIGVVAPFRYSRLPIAILIGVLIFDENPDSVTIGGCILIVISGLLILGLSSGQLTKPKKGKQARKES